jgi:hypothetical protein
MEQLQLKYWQSEWKISGVIVPEFDNVDDAKPSVSCCWELDGTSPCDKDVLNRSFLDRCRTTMCNLSIEVRV